MGTEPLTEYFCVFRVVYYLKFSINIFLNVSESISFYIIYLSILIIYIFILNAGIIIILCDVYVN